MFALDESREIQDFISARGKLLSKIHNLRMQTISCCMQCVLHGVSSSTFEISMLQGVIKGPFAALIIESFQKNFNVFLETNVVLLTYQQR